MSTTPQPPISRDTQRDIQGVGGGGTPGPGVLAVVVAGHAQSDAVQTVQALAVQTLKPDHIVVVCVLDAHDSANSLTTALDAIPELPSYTVVEAPKAHNFGQAVTAGLASTDVQRLLFQTHWVWMLHDDCVPDQRCLEELWLVADRGKTVAVVGPKQLEPEGSGLREFGIIASRSARRLNAIAPGEIDQGQYDGRADVLAVGTAGMLVRRDVWTQLGGLDPALGPFGDGLEFGRRVRRAGFRVIVAAHAKVFHRQVSARVPPDDRQAVKQSQAGQLGSRWYNWLLAAPWYLVAPIMAWLMVTVPLRCLEFLILGDRTQASAHMRGWWWAFKRTPAMFKARHRAASQAKLPRSILKPLEATRADFRRQDRLNRHIRRAQQRRERQGDPIVAASLNRWRRNTWITFVLLIIATLMVSLVLWVPKISGMAGASWAGVPGSWFDLFQAAFSAWIWAGDPITGMNDPVLIVLAVVTAPFALLGVTPTTVLRMLLIVQMPLAAAAMWWCASRFTSAIQLRTGAALSWALLPVVLVASSQGRVAMVVFHLVAPLALGAAASWWASSGGGGGPLIAGPTQVVSPLKRRRLGSGALALCAAILICVAPWMLALMWLACLVVIGINRRKSGRLWLVSLPAAVLVAPYVIDAALVGAWPTLATTGGAPLTSPAGASWTLLGGLPSAATWIPSGTHALFLAAGMLVLWLAAIGLLAWAGIRGHHRALPLSAGVVVASVFLAIAWGQHLLPVAAGKFSTVSADPSPALDLAALSMIVALIRTLTLPLPWNDRRQRKVTPAVAAITLAAVVSGGAWAWMGQMTANTWDHVHAAGRQVPAVIANAQESDQVARLLVLEAGQPWQISDWPGDGPLLTDASAITRWQALNTASPTDVEQALVTTLVTPDNAATQTLAEHHIVGILIPQPGEQTASVEASLDRAPGIERVGDTDQGRLWRVEQTAPLGATPVVYDQAWWVLVWQVASGVAVALSVIFILPRRRST